MNTSNTNSVQGPPPKTPVALFSKGFGLSQEPLPCNPAAETALQLPMCFFQADLHTHTPISPEECFFPQTPVGRSMIYYSIL